ncbi:MAG: type II and III secretion system protein, partial [Gammaproteobacteria bacterium]
GAAYAQQWIATDSFSTGVPDAVAPSFVPITGTTGVSALGAFGLITEIISTINLLEQTGDVIILAEPRLSARSGGTAEFVAGGEIPVVTSSLAGTNVEYKEFGIILEISPVVDDENNINATVSTEVSSINESLPLDPPAFLTRKTSTEVHMQDGETLVLSGLVSRNLAENIEKLPFLGDIPILGQLFRSTEWKNSLTEMVIFVTPTVFNAKSEYNQKHVNRRRELIDQWSENVEIDKETFVDRGDLILD